MSAATKELRERRLSVWEDMKTMLEASHKEGMDAEQHQKYGEMETELIRLREDIDARERAAKIEADLEKPQDLPDGATETRGQKPYENEKRAYTRAFNSWLRGADLSNEDRKVLTAGRAEFRDQLVSSGASGGYTVPEQFSNQIFEHRKWFGGMRDVAGNITTSTGADLLWPNNDDTGNSGAILAEGGALTEQDVSFGARTFKAFKYTSKLVQVSWELMQDSAFNLEEFLARKFGERLGRAENAHFTTGIGGTQPEGIMTNVTTVAPATDNTLVLKDLITLKFNVDRAYRSTGRFMCHDLIMASLLKEQSTTGDFVWQPSAQDGEPDRIFGHPIVINNDMDSTVADGKKVVVFGDLSAYLIRDVSGIAVVRLNERYADNMLTGFFAIARVDGQPSFSSTSTVPPYKALIL